MCRFLGRRKMGSPRTRAPASEKRQGTKSRWVAQRWCRGRYGDLAAGAGLRDWMAGVAATGLLQSMLNMSERTIGVRSFAGRLAVDQFPDAGKMVHMKHGAFDRFRIEVPSPRTAPADLSSLWQAHPRRKVLKFIRQDLTPGLSPCPAICISTLGRVRLMRATAHVSLLPRFGWRPAAIAWKARPSADITTTMQSSME
jgi:hypothetical protein